VEKNKMLNDMFILLKEEEKSKVSFQQFLGKFASSFLSG
jgi:hypothetical protein